MCGIVVAMSSDPKLNWYSKQISHRGTSGYGSCTVDGIIFLHHLHPIVGGNVIQPFKGRGILVANCEIYNWEQLCNEYGITARNDAELLFRILESEDDLSGSLKGILSKLDGDFACVYYRDGVIYAFRDPLGVNPLFYSLNPLLLTSERINEGQRELHPRTIITYNIKSKNLRAEYNDFFSRAPPQKPLPLLLEEAVIKRIPQVQSGLLFSGGVDSAYIALCMQEINRQPRLYTAYVGDDSPDARHARQFAKDHGFDLCEVPVAADELRHSLKEVCSAIHSSDSVKVGVAIPFHFAAKAAARDGCKVLFSGLGADDIFAGYARFKGGASIRGEQLSSLRCIYERDLYRDNTICMRQGIELRVPYLDHRLVLASLNAPEADVSDKKPVRMLLKSRYKTAERHYARPKKAAQYGSNSMAAVRALAKKSGVPVGQYLYSLSGIRNLRVGALYTGGKDSAYALYLMLQRNYEVKCLISLKSSNPHSYMFHTPRIDAVGGHAEKMGIPLVKVETMGEKEQELVDLGRALSLAISKYNIEGVITGALYSEYQRSRIEQVCDRLGLCVFSPLWHIDQEMHMRRLLKDGFKFVITSVAAEGLGKEWLNRTISEKDIDALVKLNRKYGINIAGEGGEYETLVTDCPLFKN
ncbi:MAG: diphthine--ammonia ligase [Candidatus Micrarchaeia archaeon]